MTSKQIGLNIGSGNNWHKTGWETLDHHVPTGIFQDRHQAWDLPYDNETFDYIFTSLTLEEIPSIKVEATIAEINRVLKPGGIYRVFTPDLRRIAKAYLERDIGAIREFNRDYSFFDSYIDRLIDAGLGPGAFLSHTIISPGLDNVLINSDYSGVVGSFANMYCYDFQMLSGLVKHYGFAIDDDYCTFEDSRIPDFRDLRRPYYTGMQKCFALECHKEAYISFNPETMLLHNNAPYPYRMLTQENKMLNLVFRVLGLMYKLKFRTNTTSTGVKNDQC